MYESNSDGILYNEKNNPIKWLWILFDVFLYLACWFIQLITRNYSEIDNAMPNM